MQKPALSILVTGANRGIGLEFVKQYLADGNRIYATCRQPNEATELQELIPLSRGLLSIHQLSLDNTEEINSDIQKLHLDQLDILINNAVMYGTEKSELSADGISEWMTMFKVNAIAPLLVAEALVDALATSQGKVVCLSSIMGSIAGNLTGAHYRYRSTKAALNCIMHNLAIDLRGRGVAVALVHPGWVFTGTSHALNTANPDVIGKLRQMRGILRELGGNRAIRPVAESVTLLRKEIENLTLEQSGKFLNLDGQELPW